MYFCCNRIDLESRPGVDALPSGGGAKLLSPVSRMPPSPVSLRRLDLEPPAAAYLLDFNIEFQ